ncbi:hypothetical protein LCGC14_1522860 [marine sediment metagenome]|uniref:Uncharacterized protein n=1 Tax=marine sediment metagenome TaxID=412755 RepID=A0A0F9JJ20_9ZZZZ
MTDTTHIVISKTLHALLKRYCRDRGLVMQKLVDDIIEEFLNKSPYPSKVSDSIATRKPADRFLGRGRI